MFCQMFAQSAKQCAEEFTNQFDKELAFCHSKFDKELASCHSEIVAERSQNQMLKQQNNKFRERINRLETEIQSNM